MAKLEGVKTLDMVNGEITKVAYCGTEYERVEGEAQKGDIVLVKEAWGAQNVGEFFVVTYTRSGTFDQIVGMDGNTCEASSYKHCLKIFRKVAASTNPTVEERVAKAEGEIESLKTDVASLKGEAEYKRIAKSEARAGDYVKFDEAPRGYLTAGKYYEIDYVDSNGDPYITDDAGDAFDTYCLDDDEFEVYRKVSAASVEAEPKPERLKVGDYAKVVNADQHTMDGFSVGDIVEIVESEYGEHDVDFYVMSLAGDNSGYIRKTPEYIVRATDEEVAEAKRAAEFAKFKEGAKVRLKSGGGEFPLNGYENGKVYEISYAHLQRNRIGIIGGEITMGFATPDQLEILSEEEASEYKKWAGIGREVGEYKKGDVVSYDGPEWFGNSGIGEVVGFDVGTPRVRSVNRRGDKVSMYLDPGKLRLITPVEARFDR
ncbi:hypothetical protein NRS6185_03801 [Bacillus subtilis]|nr:hypothetical protein NRS6185_03801 [Bacillus subtilis]